MAPSGGFRLHPASIKFTQDSIKAQFMDGRELSSTLEDLLYQRRTVNDIPPIEVVEDLEDYGWWALTGNRRLYLYRKLEQLGVIDTIPVVKMNFWEYGVSGRLNQRKTTFCDGKNIRLRGPQGERQINQIIERWRSSRSYTATIRYKQPVANSVYPSNQVTTPKKVESAQIWGYSENTHQTLMGVPLEQFASNWGTAKSEKDDATDEDRLLENDEDIAITRQPLKVNNNTRIYQAVDDDCCSCCSCTCCSCCCTCC